MPKPTPPVPGEPTPTRLDRIERDATATSVTVVRPEDLVRSSSHIGSGHMSTQTLDHLKGADQPADIARLLGTWHSAVTTREPAPRYALLGQLGAGAQGVVYRLIDRDCRREVAFKTVKTARSDPHDLSRFVHEAQITAQLEHPGIVPVHDFGVLSDGTVFYTMKKVEGVNLADWMTDRKGRNEHRFDLLQVFLRICEAMGFAHSRGVVHRDLKPRNIMVGRFGEVLVMDWGLAKIVDHEADSKSTTSITSVRSEYHDDFDVHRTLTGFAVGTPAYMCPESARGETERVDPRGDVFSLGVILYEMLLGESPWIRGDVQRTLQQVAAGKARPINEGRLGEGGRALAAIVRKAMAHRMEDRFPTVEMLASDLRSFLAGQAVSAYRESILETCGRALRRHRRPVIAAVLAVLVMAVGVGLWRMNEYRHQENMVQSLHREGNQKRLSGEFDAARSQFEQILALRPDDMLAQRALNEVKDDQAKALAEEEAQRIRSAAVNLRERADALVDSASIADVQRATELYLQAMGLTPGDENLDAAYKGAVLHLATLAEDQRLRRESELAHTRAQDQLSRSLAARSEGKLTEALSLAEISLHLEASDAARTQLRELDQLIADQEREAGLKARRSEADGVAAAARLALSEFDVDRAQRLIERMRGVDPDHPDLIALDQAIALAEEARRRERADALLSDARDLLADASVRQRAIEELSDTVKRQESELIEHGNPDARGMLRELEQRLDDNTRTRSANLAKAVGLLHQAHTISTTHREVTNALADYFIERMMEAERMGDRPRAEAAEAQARVFDDGSRERLLSGIAEVSVAATGSEVVVYRLVPGPDRSDMSEGEAKRIAAGERIDLSAGRYVFESADGIRFARRLGRGESLVLDVPALPTIPAGSTFVPAGPVYSADGRLLRNVDTFVMTTHEITCGEYVNFLNDPATRRRIVDRLHDGVLVYAPRGGIGATESLWRSRGSLTRGVGGTFSLELGDGSPVDPQQPVSNVSFEDALAYADWRAVQDGVPWKLPSRDQWLLAAQGGDGRAQPWGMNADPGLCYSFIAALRNGDSRSLMPVGSFPKDRSVQGIEDLAGSLSEFVIDLSADPSLGVLVGGNRADRQAERFTVWSRREILRRMASANCGIRLAAVVQ